MANREILLIKQIPIIELFLKTQSMLYKCFLLILSIYFSAFFLFLKAQTLTYIKIERDLNQIYPDIVTLQDNSYLVSYTTDTYPPKIWKIMIEKFDNLGNQKTQQITSENYSMYSKMIKLSNDVVFLAWFCYTKDTSGICGASVNTSDLSIIRQFDLVRDYTKKKNFGFLNLITFQKNLILIWDNQFKIYDSNLVYKSENFITNNEVELGIEACNISDEKVVFLFNSKSRLMASMLDQNLIKSDSESFLENMILGNNNPILEFKCTALPNKNLAVIYTQDSYLNVKMYSKNLSSLSGVTISSTGNGNQVQLGSPSITSLVDGGFLITYFNIIEKKFYHQRFNRFGTKIDEAILMNFPILFEFSMNDSVYRVQPKLAKFDSGAVILTFHADVNQRENQIYGLDSYTVFIENCFYNNYYKNFNGLCFKPNKCKDSEFNDYLRDNNCIKCGENLICPGGENCKLCNSCYDRKTCATCISPTDHLFFDEKMAITYCSSKSTSGYYQINSINFPCSDNCKKCSNVVSCIECLNGYELKNELCTKINCDNICPPNAEGCQKCLACSSQSVCNLCASGNLFYDSLTEYTYCSNRRKTGFYNENGIYKECMNDCLDCEKAEICNECAIGYYFNGKICVPCGSDCVKCQSDRKCTICVDNYLPNPSGVCEIASCCSEKDKSGSCVNYRPYYFFNKITKNCENCPDKCSKCFDKNSCLECDKPLVFKNGLCKCETLKNCDSGEVICNSCKDGFFKVSSCECQSCMDGCKTCDGKNSCKSCFSGYQPIYIKDTQQNQILDRCGDILECKTYDPNDPKKCLICNDQYYLDESSRCAKCTQFDLDCLDCKGLGICTLCSQNKLLYNGKCRDPTTICQINGCDKCVENNPNKCIYCKEGYINNNGNCDFLDKCIKREGINCISCISGYTPYKTSCECNEIEDLDWNACCKKMKGCDHNKKILKYFPEFQKCGCVKCDQGFVKSRDMQCIEFNLDEKCTYINQKYNIVQDIGKDCIVNQDLIVLPIITNCFSSSKIPELKHDDKHFRISLKNDSLYYYKGYNETLNVINDNFCDNDVQFELFFSINCTVSISESSFDFINLNKKIANSTMSKDYLIKDIFKSYLNDCEKKKFYIKNNQFSLYLRNMCFDTDSVCVDLVNDYCLPNSYCMIKKDYQMEYDKVSDKYYDCGKNWFYDYKKKKCFTRLVLDDAKYNNFIYSFLFADLVIFIFILLLTLLYFFPRYCYEEQNKNNKTNFKTEENEIRDNMDKEFNNKTCCINPQSINNLTNKDKQVIEKRNSTSNLGLNSVRNDNQKIPDRNITKEEIKKEMQKNIKQWLISFFSFLDLFLDLTFLFYNKYIHNIFWIILIIIIVGHPLFYIIQGTIKFCTRENSSSTEKCVILLYLSFIFFYTIGNFFNIFGNDFYPDAINFETYLRILKNEKLSKLEKRKMKLNIKKIDILYEQLPESIYKIFLLALTGDIDKFSITLVIISVVILIINLLMIKNEKKSIDEEEEKEKKINEEKKTEKERLNIIVCNGNDIIPQIDDNIENIQKEPNGMIKEGD